MNAKEKFVTNLNCFSSIRQSTADIRAEIQSDTSRQQYI
jgi:hypothetical protein